MERRFLVPIFLLDLIISHPYDSAMKKFPKLLTCLLFIAFLSACNSTSPVRDKNNDSDYITKNQRSTNFSKREFNVSANKRNTRQQEIQEQAEEELKKEIAAAVDHESDDLWQVISNNLELDRSLNEQTVQDKIAWFARNQEYIDRVAQRAKPYLYHIVTRLKERGMPLDLALLPIVESAYQPFAHSPSSASGIWQFIPGTGTRYGLKQNWWYDGRRDIVAATEAALDYLESLSQRFNGDWYHALAAYNAGEGNVERAIAKNKNAGKPIDFWSLSLPNETKGYVPSLLAVAEVLKETNKYSIHFSPIQNKPFFEVVDVGSQIDLSTVAKLSELSIDDIYTLNPGFSRWATDPDGPHGLLIPLQYSEGFKQRLAALPQKDRVSWVRHTIKQGESLNLIAHKYNTSVAALKQTNKLRSNLIRAGNSLLIPTSKENSQFYSLSSDSRKFRGLKKSGDGKKYVYTVQSGDNLWDIGNSYGISVNDLTDWNGITSRSILRPGQKLVVWVKEDEDSEEGFIEVAAASTPQREYVVKSGDSLWSIARKFDIHVNDLMKWNKLNKSHTLQPGQSLIVEPLLSGA